jgi:predicted phosphodiesterase
MWHEAVNLGGVMRIAVISDIHGNCLALDAVLADLKGQVTDRLVCLGDAIQGGPQPAQVVARLRELACPVVMGNADAWLLTGKDTGKEPIHPERLPVLNAVREWSLTQLSADDRAFIVGFQPTVTLELDGKRSLLCFHGSPASFDDVILPDTPEEEFQHYLGPWSSSILTGGHTHMQQIRRIGDGFYFNPGSVGLTYSHHQPEGQSYTDPWAEYAILTSDETALGLEFRRVPIDIEELVQLYRASGRPYAGQAAAQYLHQ